MARRVRFGVTVPQLKRSWEEARRVARELDRLGFDALLVCDHLYGVPAPDVPILEAWSELAAVAAVTERAELGTLVSPPFFRHPAVLAKQIATIDQIAGGRVFAGLGAGWYEGEFRGYGLPFPPLPERQAALEETIQILRLLWTQERPSFEGRHFSVKEVVCEPKPVRVPPILVGGTGERLLGIAARHADLWNNPAVSQPQLGAKVAALRRRCDEVGRDPAEVEVSQQCIAIVAEDEAAARAALQKAGRIYGGHMGVGLEEHGIWGGPQRVIDCIERHVRLGCTFFAMELFGRDPLEPARLFAEKVFPAFRDA